ncbi:hypothetical protein ACFLU6_09510 [Acidobacteriota bacterium]
MFKALLWKEWKHLRLIRWLGIALGFAMGLALPFVMTTLSASSNSLSVQEFLYDITPVLFYCFLFPLAAMWTSLHAFCSDRASGTETFLLERPVSRTAVWISRFLASYGSALLIAYICNIAWILLCLVMGVRRDILMEDISLLLWAPLVVIGILIIVGMGASAFLSAPMAALLLALIMTLMSVGLGGLLWGLCPLASINQVPVSLVVPALLFVGFAAASYAAFCRGEPAGRGRIVRAVTVIALALVLSIVLFLIFTPFLIRRESMKYMGGGYITPSGHDDAILLTDYYSGSAPAFLRDKILTSWVNSGWIVNPEKAEKLAFLPPPVLGGEWKKDGSRLAVLTAAGPYGSVRDRWRIEFYDAQGRKSPNTIEFKLDAEIHSMDWVGDQLAVDHRLGPIADLLIISPDTGEFHTLLEDHPAALRQFVGPAEDGTLFVAMAPKDTRPQRDEDKNILPMDFALHRVDLRKMRIEPEPLLKVHDYLDLASLRLSPSGRYWTTVNREEDTVGLSVIDIKTGQEALTIPQLCINSFKKRSSWIIRRYGERSYCWLQGDRLGWLEPGKEEDPNAVAFLLATPGASPRSVRAFPEGIYRLYPSPDGTSILISGWFKEESTYTKELYDLATDEWRALSVTGVYVEWASPRILAQHRFKQLAFESLDAPGELRYVIGSPD